MDYKGLIDNMREYHFFGAHLGRMQSGRHRHRNPAGGTGRGYEVHP